MKSFFPSAEQFQGLQSHFAVVSPEGPVLEGSQSCPGRWLRRLLQRRGPGLAQETSSRPALRLTPPHHLVPS